MLAATGPPLTYFRAGMIVGAGSESFRTLYHLVRRLPVMIAPAWLRTRTQPIGIDDVLGYLRAAPDAGVARPLVEGLSTETVVRDPSGAALFDVQPARFADAVRDALREAA